MTNFRKLIGIFLVLTLIGSMMMPVNYALEFEKNSIEPNTLKEFKDGFIIVQFGKGLNENDKSKHKEELGLTLEKKGKKAGLELLKLNGNKDVKDVIAKLNKKKGVIFAEPDYLLYPTLVPNDRYYSSNYMWGMFDIDTSLAWNDQWGDPSIIVAVIDTGVQVGHKDLSENIWTNTGETPNNGIDDDNNGYIDDVNGWDFNGNNNSVYDSKKHDDHGTHVSGTIAAVGDNGIGVVGVAPGVTIMPLKFLGPNGGSTFDAIEAINYAKDKGAKIINASWGGGGFNQSLENAIQAFGDDGGVFIAAAGNDGVNTDSNPHYPSSYNLNNIISIAAIDSSSSLASFSNYGQGSVDIAGPGVSIASTYPSNRYAYMSGTSMAAPHVSGIVALMLSKNPDLTPTEVFTYLDNGGRAISSLDNKTVTGKTVNAKGALDLVPDPSVDPIDYPPTVIITEPADNSFVLGTVIVSADVTDDNGINKVEFWIDGVLESTLVEEPYTIDLGLIPDGTHVIRVDATDTNETMSSDEVSVTVDNVSPVVSIFNPTTTDVNGDLIIDVYVIESNIESVNYEIDGVIGSMTYVGDKWTTTWDSSSVANGEYTIKVIVIDKVGLIGEDTILVNVNNEPTEPPELISDVLLKYRINSRKGTATVQATVKVTDGNGNPVSGIVVDGYWIYPDNTEYQRIGTTDALGAVTFKISKVPNDTYDFIVDTLTAN